MRSNRPINQSDIPKMLLKHCHSLA